MSEQPAPKPRYRIAIAGFQHETNTHAPSVAGLAEFRVADSWPAMLEGAAVIDQTRGMNLPIAGAIMAAEQSGEVELIPLLWCAAEPSGRVTDDAFDTISGRIIDGVCGAGGLDAIYLDLHGAMVTDSYDDGEAALLERLRAIVGRDLPIGVSLDLHANLSERFVEAASQITIYRSYPHLDMAETGERCMAAVLAQLHGRPSCFSFRQIPFLIPLHAQYTGQAPGDRLYGLVESLPHREDESLELALGFTAAEIPDCGPSLVARAPTQTRAEALAEQLYQAVCESEHEFDTTLYAPAEAVALAMQNTDPRPVVLADVQDNPGAGGSSDTTGLLRALIAAKARGAILGVIADPAAAAAALAAGEGAEIDVPLGGQSGHPDDAPLKARWCVKRVSDGQIPYTGEMYGGGVASLGASCLLAHADEQTDIHVVVGSTRVQCLDQALFSHFGLDPARARLVVVKSTVHFKADFDQLASRVLSVASPGYFSCVLDTRPAAE